MTRRYNLSEFEEWLPPAPPEDTPGAPFHMPVEKVGQGERNLLLFRLARSLKAKGLTPDAILAALREENRAKCDPPHDEPEVQRAFTSAMSQPDRPFTRPVEAATNGDGRPTGDPMPHEPDAAHATDGGRATDPDAPGLLPDPEREPLEAVRPDDPETIRLTEAEARALVAAVPYEDLADATDVRIGNYVVRWFGAGLRWTAAERRRESGSGARWWTGTHWASDQTRGRFAQCVLLTTRFLRAAARDVAIPDAVLRAATAAQREKHPKLSEREAAGRAERDVRRGLDLGLRAYRNTPKHAHVTTLVVAMPPIRFAIERYDAHPHLFNVLNGTLRLHHGTAAPHRAEDYLTRMIDIAYDPDAQCPRFQRFLLELFPDRALAQPPVDQAPLRLFLQHYLGYCLTGDVSEQIVVFFTGTGSNGKSILLRILKRVFGPYMATVQRALLLDDRRGRPAEAERMHEIAGLKGVRLAVLYEPPAEDQLSAAAVKYLSGGDTLKGRFLYGDAFEFRPSHKLLVIANDLPETLSQGIAVWRRLKVVEFGQRFYDPGDPDYADRPPNAPDAEDEDHLLADLEAELPGILTWLVQGAAHVATHGLTIPEAVRARTKEVRDAQDPLQEFLDTETDRGDTAWTASTDLYGRYAEWDRVRRGFRPDATVAATLTTTAFGTALRHHGFTPGKEDGARGWHGLALRARGPA